MYWLPAIFIIIELIYINVIDMMSRFGNSNILLKKYKDEELKSYIKKEYDGMEKMSMFIGFFLLFEFIYFIVGFFYPFWMVSAVFIGLSIIATIISKIKGKNSIEKTIKLAHLNGFTSSDVKFDRLLKLNELKRDEIKTSEWALYISPIIKIVVFIAIIVLHYNYKMI